MKSWQEEKPDGAGEDLNELTLASFRACVARRDPPLDPGWPAVGRHNPTWQVIENLHDGR